MPTKVVAVDMNMPKLTTPNGLFDYLIGLIIVLAAIAGLYIVAVMTGVIAPWF
ncbi:hypothetical protein ZOD2009_08109 [Haladaptatus paucihalophilus DX253]|uniref:Uncharacterized protein n=2 Tax=Haladaptatus paucihalophilus DX253 TaxID=797209 RepID=E7QS49_HALPU|nr:hypothetical protein ZOD2009_08109 [Haladaptatus paucihalophilus DX253]GKZ13586.1 hypothetical protein HAL_14670 [Haladaptatus sp. T7]